MVGAMSSIDDPLYDLMYDLGDSRVRERFISLRDSGRFASTAPGAALAAKASGELLKVLKTYMSRKKVSGRAALRVRQLIKEVGTYKCAALTIRFMVNELTQGMGQGSSRGEIGKLRVLLGHTLKQEADFGYLSRADPGRYDFLSRRLDRATQRTKTKFKSILAQNLEVADCGWDREDSYLIGTCMLDLAMRECGMFTVTRHKTSPFKGKSKIVNAVEFTPEILEWIMSGVDSMAEALPTRLPITEPPLDWGPNQRGGYRERTLGHMPLMTTGRRSQYTKFLESHCPEVYSGVNTLQRTGWKVNPVVLEVLEAAYKFDWTDAGLFQLPVEPGPQPPGEYDKKDPAWRDHAQARRTYKMVRKRYVADKLSMGRCLTVAHIYKDFERFYFPHQIDFRGRCYTIGTPMSYQGPDYQRGLLMFAEGKRIETREGLEWFMIHGANCWGEDKVPFADRVQWVKDNSSWIVRCAADAFDNRQWVDASKPFQFLAWCNEYAAMLRCEDALDHVSHIPVCMDGSNNGLQIYSLLLRDPVGGAATNCSPSDRPQDAYKQVADVLTQKLEEHAAGDDTKHARWARRVLDFCKRQGYDGIPRDAVKRPVMTQPYGATHYSCQHYLVSWYHEYVRGKVLYDDAPFPERDAYFIWSWVGTLTWESISVVVEKAVKAMQWLRDVSQIMSDHGEHCEWTTPLGAVVSQYYTKGTTRRVRLKAGGCLSMRLWEDDGIIHKRKASNGFCPNYIHSLDASAMFRTVNQAALQGVTSFQMIHDSFGTHACDAGRLARTLRESFVDLFSVDLLERLRVELQAQLPDEVILPEPPLSGSLDINRLHESQYFFA